MSRLEAWGAALCPHQLRPLLGPPVLLSRPDGSAGISPLSHLCSGTRSSDLWTRNTNAKVWEELKKKPVACQNMLSLSPGRAEAGGHSCPGRAARATLTTEKPAPRVGVCENSNDRPDFLVNPKLFQTMKSFFKDTEHAAC